MYAVVKPTNNQNYLVKGVLELTGFEGRVVKVTPEIQDAKSLADSLNNERQFWKE